MNLALHFSRSSNPELFRIEFSHPVLGRSISAARGKSGLGTSDDSFQWTPAVKALAILILRTAAELRRAGAEKLCRESNLPSLEGEERSPAASLDFALGREPVWLTDVFGRDRSGAAFSRKLFRRTNPERRLPGPVTIMLNAATWDGADIVVELDGRAVIDSVELHGLASKIERSWKTYKPRPRVREQESSRSAGSRSLASEIRSLLVRETEWSLNARDIFHSRMVEAQLKGIDEVGVFRRMSGRAFPALGESSLRLGPAERLGLSRLSAVPGGRLRERPLTIMTSPTLTGALVIFEYLRRVKGAALEVDWEYPHAIEIVRRMIQDRLKSLPDLLCCHLGPAATVVSSRYRREYLPLMFMPDGSCGMVAPKRQGRTKSGIRISLLHEEPSLPSFALEEFRMSGRVNREWEAIDHAEPGESFSRLKHGDGNERAILFFPHYHINCLFNNCEPVPELRQSAANRGVVLFIRRELFEDVELSTQLCIAIRDAWLELRTFAAVREEAINLLSNDEHYMRFLVRCSGLSDYRLSC